MAGWIALALAMCVLWRLPVCACALATYSGSLRAGFGLGLAGPRGAMRRAERRLRSGGRRKRPLSLEKTDWAEAAMDGARYLYARRLLLKIRVDAALGGADAAMLAMAGGAARGLLEALAACTEGSVAGTVREDFAAPETRAALCAVFSARAGDALTALLRAAGKYAEKRAARALRKGGDRWRDIPLKTS